MSHLSSAIIKETSLYPVATPAIPRTFSISNISPRGENKRRYVIIGEGIKYGGIVDHKAEFFIIETGLNLTISSPINEKDEWFVVSIFPASKAKISIERYPYPKDAKILIHTSSMKDKRLIEKRMNSLICYKVSYIIPKPGYFQVNITCRGTDVDKSPYTIIGIQNKLKFCFKILNFNVPSVLKVKNSKLKDLSGIDDLAVRRLASIGVISIYAKKRKTVSLRKHWSDLIKIITNGDDGVITRNLNYLLILILTKDKILTKRIFTEEIFSLIKKILGQQKNKQMHEVCVQFIACLINVERTAFNSCKILNEVKYKMGYQMFFNLLYSPDNEKRKTVNELFEYLFSSHELRQRLFNRDNLHAIIRAVLKGELINSQLNIIDVPGKRLDHGSSTIGKHHRKTMVDFNKPEEYARLHIGKLLSLGASALIKRGIYRGQIVVIKVFEKLHISYSIKSFYIELLIMNHIAHPNIMPCVGASMKEDNLFIVMELLKIGSIYDMIHGKESSSTESRLIHLINFRRWACILSIAKQISLGMAHLHSYQIIHRDLKSHNILLSDPSSHIDPIKGSSSGINYQVKLIDFGTCRDNDNTRHMTGGTGTIQWSAPEVLNHGIYDLSADVYSFGIVLWELLTHQIPYHGMPIHKIADSVISHNLRPPIPETCPYFLRNLLNICWHENPKRRPTFQQLAKDFDKFNQQYLPSTKQKVTSHRRGKAPESEDAELLRRYGPQSRPYQLSSLPKLPLPL